jgi:uncharacterized membrane protein YraQ (UPF0718 family)
VTAQTRSGARPFTNASARFLRRWGFVLSVAAAYTVIAFRSRAAGAAALAASCGIMIQVALPLGVAFVFSCLLNLFVKPEKVTGLLGRRAGLRGVALSSLAGIVSVGPVYAWYPLLRSLREKGASAFHLANFLSNRAVKPYLLPVMIAYFGWRFTLAVSVLCVAGSLVTASAVSWVTGEGTRQ